MRDQFLKVLKAEELASTRLRITSSALIDASGIWMYARASVAVVHTLTPYYSNPVSFGDP
jgi:hypothetical protein